MELAGVVLGAIPLLIEVSKAHTHNVNAFRRALGSKHSTQVLLDFCNDFWAQTDILYRQLRRLIDKLPHLSQERRDQLKKNRDWEAWKADDVAASLKEAFQDDENYESFHRCLLNVGRMLWKLTSEFRAGNYLPDGSPAFMLQNLPGELRIQLEAMERSMTLEGQSSRFWKRFRLLKNENNLEILLGKLEKWTKHLRGAIDSVPTPEDLPIRPQPPAVHLGKVTSSTPLHSPRRLSELLFTALSTNWHGCQCANPHEARFALSQSKGINIHQDRISFDFLISHHTEPHWREVHIHALAEWSAESRTLFQDISHDFDGICNQFSLKGFSNRRLCLLVDGATQPSDPSTQASHSVKQLQWDGLEHRAWKKNLPLSFQEILEAGKPSLLERRKLALTFARSLLQMHESPWLSDQWDKSRIHFYYTEGIKGQTREYHLQQPYMSTSFASFGSQKLETDILKPPMLHRNPGILKLALLLMEINQWASIESPGPGTSCSPPISRAERPARVNDCVVAVEEAFEAMDKSGGRECSKAYRQAIKDCIEINWAAVVGGGRVSLNDQEVWQRVCDRIIKPLEKEVRDAAADLHVESPKVFVEAPWLKL
ncbi:hypothetical protein QBC43DRAFT_373104 [Cladorrhinum sp. PSN259]|nr:hypothetical protein QBC43DRAFT_373104 [Cladorrhinum sp. PSN259]